MSHAAWLLHDTTSHALCAPHYMLLHRQCLRYDIPPTSLPHDRMQHQSPLLQQYTAIQQYTPSRTYQPVNEFHEWMKTSCQSILLLLKTNPATVMGSRNIGEWSAVEREMAEWAHRRQILRRTDISCRRRYRNLEPEKFERYARVSKLTLGTDNKQQALNWYCTALQQTRRFTSTNTYIYIDRAFKLALNSLTTNTGFELAPKSL